MGSTANVFKIICFSINGFGSIGKRVADAVSLHDKLKLVGVSKYTPDGDARLANLLGYDLFVPEDNRKKFTEKIIEIEGSVEEMIEQSDVVVDASSGGRGIQNRQDVYSPKGKRSFIAFVVSSTFSSTASWALAVCSAMVS